jgi:hypothetical protein
VNFGEIYYDWGNMLNTYSNAASSTEQQQNAIATLMYHIAVSMNTDFINTGSSSQGGGYAHLINSFGYDRDLENIKRSYYDNDAEWEAILKAQLDARLPVRYNGENSEGKSSHYFVVDGYDNAGKFHINMGYRGSSDGWYFLNDIKYGTDRDLSYQQGMTINIKPDQGGTGTNRMALIVFTPSKTSVSQNEPFTVTVQMRGVGYFSGGNVGVALVGNNGSIVEVIGNRNTSERYPGGTSSTYEVNSLVPNTIVHGQYKLRIVIRPTGGDWKLVELSEVGNGVPTSIDFEVK